METKTRTNDQGTPNPGGEVQVRELGDVLNKSIDDLDVLKKERLKEFEKIMNKHTGEEILNNDETRYKLYTILTESNYKQIENQANVKTYIRYQPDQSVDVVVFNDLATSEAGQKNRGISYIKLENAAEFKEYEQKFENFANFKTKKPEYGFRIGVSGFFGMIGGLIMRGIDDSTLSGLIAGTLVFGGMYVLTSIADKTDIKQNNKNVKGKVEKNFQKYKKNMWTGFSALNRAIYNK
ncbi:hypothetical protein HOK51_07395 [Candidatus Woesearchaeota archaeon]|jgi:hypothetical protein|nr:hypothetical protein [Candidatus Woesearchaeota archaeon]MBT6519647.1 hypothetical protein [Candidatus Woesearchaeota archaeon]MBT7368505.1 hypothetical protein [Candidatus Woesearchaeota archaeon]